MKVISNNGVPVDMTRYLAQNEDSVAIGNARMNARGDLLGPRGKIVKPREQVAAEYHSANPKAVKKVALRDLTEEITPAPVAVVDEPPAIAPMDEEFLDPAHAWKKAEADSRKVARKKKIEDSED